MKTRTRGWQGFVQKWGKRKARFDLMLGLNESRYSPKFGSDSLEKGHVWLKATAGRNLGLVSGLG